MKATLSRSRERRGRGGESRGRGRERRGGGGREGRERAIKRWVGDFAVKFPIDKEAESHEMIFPLRDGFPTLISFSFHLQKKAIEDGTDDLNGDAAVKELSDHADPSTNLLVSQLLIVFIGDGGYVSGLAMVRSLGVCVWLVFGGGRSSRPRLPWSTRPLIPSHGEDLKRIKGWGVLLGHRIVRMARGRERRGKGETTERRKTKQTTSAEREREKKHVLFIPNIPTNIVVVVVPSVGSVELQFDLS
jgi:hypothetical protein